MVQAGMRVMVHVVDQHDQDLSDMLAGDGDGYIAERHLPNSGVRRYREHQ